MNKNYPVYTMVNECQDCYKCVRVCLAKAIRLEGGHASVIGEKCTACGSCVTACPANAKRVRDDVDKAKALISAGGAVYVSLAPSWKGMFNCSRGKMADLLKQLGFTGVSETALGAQEVSIETTRMINQSEKGLFISSACPVIVDHIRYYMPEFASSITPIGSPALTHAKLLKQHYGEQISIVFIGPCVGKKNEAARRPELIDVALTFEELARWVDDKEINLDALQDTEDFYPNLAHEGSLYPIEGGMNETLRMCGIERDVRLISFSSLGSFERGLRGIKPEEVQGKIFIEGLACDGGCVNGPGMPGKKAGVTILANIMDGVLRRPNVPKKPSVVVTEEYIPRPVQTVEYTITDIKNVMKKIGKTSEADELNCGGCGYPTCRELAKALLSGEAEPSMCVSYMRKIAMKKAAAMLRSMPSAAVIFDNEMKIVEANEAFVRMFCGEMADVFLSRNDGLAGTFLDRLIDFAHILKPVLNTGQDIRRDHYPSQNRILDITAFSIEKGQLVGAVITDVTLNQLNREKIAGRAQEVISKNISIVQNIACLLGEHMVETELLLSSIAQDYEDKEDQG